ncbi:MAG: oxidoreductase [Epsilonproteobacteria bacterium]|nr:oxidoreductase [Campylobacterota bacterium]
MENRFDEDFAEKIKDDPLALRVYTSNIIGEDENLVLHGGGNTSVKIGDYLYVKGSGWDLSSIKKEGFAAVRLDTLQEMAKLQSLKDSEMVKRQKEAMKDKNAPNPSIEAILHAIIPFKFVDHTHADAVVTISNSVNGRNLIKELYKDDFLIIDYVMPGFILAKEIYEKTKNIDWNKIEGIILLNHGVFTFDNDAKKSYEKMLNIVNKAEEFLQKEASLQIEDIETKPISKEEMELLGKEISKLRGERVESVVLDSKEAKYFASLKNVEEIVKNGVLTPEHVIRIKPFPLIIQNDIKQDIENFAKEYEEYFKKFAKDEIMLDPAPRWGIYKNRAVLIFPKDEKEKKILKDIISHTIKAMLRAEKLGGWKSLNQKDLFDMEYWELEQAKLKKRA